MIFLNYYQLCLIYLVKKMSDLELLILKILDLLFVCILVGDKLLEIIGDRNSRSFFFEKW